MSGFFIILQNLKFENDDSFTAQIWKLKREFVGQLGKSEYFDARHFSKENWKDVIDREEEKLQFLMHHMNVASQLEDQVEKV